MLDTNVKDTYVAPEETPAVDPFAPPTAEELSGVDPFAPPKPEELAAADPFAPPTEEELAAAPIPARKSLFTNPLDKTPVYWSPSEIDEAKVEEIATKHGVDKPQVRLLMTLIGGATAIASTEDKDEGLDIANRTIEESVKQSGKFAFSNAMFQTMAYLTGANQHGELESVAQAVGGFNRMLGGLPFFLLKQAESPAQEALIDDVTSALGAETVLSYGLAGALMPAKWMGAATTAVKPMIAKAAPRALEALGVSAETAARVTPALTRAAQIGVFSAESGTIASVISGLAARKGEVLPDMVKGFGAGAALPIIGIGAGKLAGRAGGWMLKKFDDVKMLDVENSVKKIIEAKRPALAELYRYITTGKIEENAAKLEEYAKQLGITKRDVIRYLKTSLGDEYIPAMVRPGNAYRTEALQGLLISHANELGEEFVNTYLNKFSSLKKGGVDMTQLLRGLRSPRAFEEAMTNYDFIPEAVRLGAMEVYKAAGNDRNNFKKGIRVIDQWVDRIGMKERFEDRKLTREALASHIDAVAHTTGQDKSFISLLWDQYNSAREISHYLDRAQITAPSAGGANWVVNRILAPQYRFDRMGRVYGMDDLGISAARINNMLTQFERKRGQLMEHVSTSFGDDFNKVSKSFGDKWDPRVFYQLHENPGFIEKRIASGKLDVAPEVLSEMHRQSEKLSAVQDYLYEELKSLGFTVDRRAGYISHQVSTPSVAVLKMEEDYNKGTIKDLQGNILTIRKFLEPPHNPLESKKVFTRYLENDEHFRDFVDSVEYLSHKTINDSDSLKNAINSTGDLPGVVDRLSPFVTAAYRRSKTKAMPWLIREVDPIRTIERYIGSSFRAAYTQRELANITKYLPVLEKLAKNTAKSGTGTLNMAQRDYDFLRDYVNRVMGYNAKKQASWISKKSLAMAKQAAVKYNVDSQKVNNILEMSSNVARVFTNLAYSSLMVNPKSYIRNFEAPWAMTAGEIGPQAYSWAGEAFFEVAMQPHAAFGATKEALLTSGKLAIRELGESVEKIRYGTTLGARLKAVPQVVSEKGILGGAAHASDVLAEAVLTGFTKTEEINRVVTVIMARKWTDSVSKMHSPEQITAALKDLQNRGTANKLQAFGTEMVEARKVIGNRSASIEARAAARKQLETAHANFKDMAEDYLLQRTQFVYSDLNKAQLARDVGPLLSMFTKWPMEITGRMINRVLSGNARKGVEEAVTPLVTMALAGAWLKDKAEKDERVQAMLEFYPGKGGFETHAPIANLASWNVMKNPPLMAKLAADFASSVLGSERAVANLTYQLGRTFVPGMALSEAIGDDIITRLGKGRAESPVKDYYKELIDSTAGDWFKDLKGRVIDAWDAAKDLGGKLPGFSSDIPESSESYVKVKMPEGMQGGKGILAGIERDVKSVVNPLINAGGYLAEAMGTKAEFVEEPETYQGAPSMAAVPGKLIKAGKAIKYGETGAIAAKNWFKALPKDAKGIATMAVEDGKLLVNGKQVGMFESNGTAKTVAMQWENAFKELGQTFERLWK